MLFLYFTARSLALVHLGCWVFASITRLDPRRHFCSVLDRMFEGDSKVHNFLIREVQCSVTVDSTHFVYLLLPMCNITSRFDRKAGKHALEAPHLFKLSECKTWVQSAHRIHQPCTTVLIDGGMWNLCVQIFTLLAFKIGGRDNLPIIRYLLRCLSVTKPRRPFRFPGKSISVLINAQMAERGLIHLTRALGCFDKQKIPSNLASSALS